ncbi:MAG: DUF4112 domain-containing protein [Verrucomicrobiota bacterium]
MSEEQDLAPATAKEQLREKARTSKRIAWLLDECIRIPGTKIKFGLDPIIGLIPGAGETTATIIGASVLADAGKKGIPIRTLFKMGGNMGFNAIIGAIPGVGDLFSVWFKSNSRNYKMLQEFMDSDDGSQARGGWWPFMVIFVILLTIIAINIAMLFMYGFAAIQVKKSLGL